MNIRNLVLGMGAAAFILGAVPAFAADDWSLPVKSRSPAFDQNGAWTDMVYKPMSASDVTKKWDICVLYPHTKDPYYSIELRYQQSLQFLYSREK